MKILLLACSIPALTIAAAIAQTKPAPPPPAQVLACNATAHDNSGFTECEAMKIMYIQGLETPLKVQINSYERQKMEFIETLAPNYPGKAYEPPSSQFPAGRMVDPQKEQQTGNAVNQRRPGTLPPPPPPTGAVKPGAQTPIPPNKPATTPKASPPPMIDSKP